MVFTDGSANDDDNLPAASKAWADQDVAVFAEGIGNKFAGGKNIYGKCWVQVRQYIRCTVEIAMLKENF